jgi:hypothetical protein
MWAGREMTNDIESYTSRIIIRTPSPYVFLNCSVEGIVRSTYETTRDKVLTIQYQLIKAARFFFFVSLVFGVSTRTYVYKLIIKIRWFIYTIYIIYMCGHQLVIYRCSPYYIVLSVIVQLCNGSLFEAY